MVILNGSQEIKMLEVVPMKKHNKRGRIPSHISFNKTSEVGHFVENEADENGYKFVMLWNVFTQRYEKKYVHELVAEAFVPNPDHKTNIRHKNGDIRDNRAENLEWV